jgi:hypothetical protein
VASEEISDELERPVLVLVADAAVTSVALQQTKGLDNR